MGILRTVSQGSEPFANRIEAGRLLGNELLNLSGENPVVLGIPRGGVVVAMQLALLLHAELDVVLSRKLGAPGNPELAIGALNEDGKLILIQDVISRLGRYEEIKGYVEEQKAKQIIEIQKRVTKYREVKPKVPLKGRTVVITDDGIATGATMQASLWAARKESPAKLIAAVPVATSDAVKRIADLADETIVLKMPPFFYAVGQFYSQFDQTTDDEVLAILRESMKGKERQ